MTTKPHLETTLTLRASQVLKQSTVMPSFRLLFIGYQPAKGSLSRVVSYIGDDLNMPSKSTPVVVAGLNAAHGMLKRAERNPGTNTVGYLALAAVAILMPLRLACQLRVADTDDDIWNPRYSAWYDWRQAHPGTLAVRREDKTELPLVLPELGVLERRLLGDIYVGEIESYLKAPESALAC